MSWQEYVDSGLVGSGKISMAALVGHDGSVWAQSSNFPGLAAGQLEALLKGFQDPSGLRVEGIRIGNDKYITLRADDRSIYGKKGATGIMAIKTKQVMIVAMYDDKTQPGDASKVAEGIADYLISVGF